MPVPQIVERNAGLDRLNLRSPQPYSVGNAGAVGDGVVDDAKALLGAVEKQGNVGAIYFPPGVYRIGQNVTVPSEAVFAFGATLKPDAGVTVTLAGPVTTAPGESVVSPATDGVVTVSGSVETDSGFDGRVPLDTLVNYYAFGDSFTQGTGASSTPKRYVNIIGQTIKSYIENRGIGARGVYRMWREMCVYLPVTLRSCSLVTMMGGLNDIRRGGADPKTLLKIENCHRAAIALALAETVYAADNVLVTQNGTWTTAPLVGDGLRTKAGTINVAGNALQATSGNSLEYTFVNDNVVIWPWVSDGVTYNFGPATIDIDGVVVQTYDPNNQTDGITDQDNDNGRVPTALVFKELGSGSHVLTITPTSATLPFVVDCIGHLAPPQNGQPVIVAGPTYMLASTYGASSPYNLATPALITATNDTIESVCDEFGPPRPVRFFRVNQFFDKNNDSDGLHPNDAGHAEIARGFLAQVAPTLKSAYRGTGNVSTALGEKAQATAEAATAFGNNAVASNQQAMAIGYASVASGPGGHAIGIAAVASGASTTAVGYTATASGNNSTAVGNGSVSSGSGSTALGRLAVAAFDNSTAVGKDATTTKPSEVMLGIAGQEVHIPGVLSIVDGMTAPGTIAGRATIYVDTADGDLKVRFGDGTIKTIVTDT
jgi:lysophospholipase L1-like esterase